MSPWFTIIVGPGLVSPPGVSDQPTAFTYSVRGTVAARAGVEKANGTKATNVRLKTSPNTAAQGCLRAVVFPSAP
jgi:hypothetical protein